MPQTRADVRSANLSAPAHDDVLDHLIVTPSPFQRLRPALDAIFYGSGGGTARAQATRRALASNRR